MAEHLIDRAAFGDHPLGRPVLGPADHLRTFSRDAIVAFRERRWSGRDGGAFLVGNLDGLPENGALEEAFGRFPDLPEPGRARCRPGARAPGARRGARLQPVAPAHELPAEDRRVRQGRAGGDDHLRHAARRLDGLAPVRRDPRAARPGLLGPRAHPRDERRADPPALGRPGLDQDASRPTRACGRSSRSCGRTGRPTRRSSAPAPTPPAPASWPSRARTPWPARRPSRSSSTARRPDADETIAALDAVTVERGGRDRPRGRRRAGRGLRRTAHGRGLRVAPFAARLRAGLWAGLGRRADGAAVSALVCDRAVLIRERSPVMVGTWALSVAHIETLRAHVRLGRSSQRSRRGSIGSFESISSTALGSSKDAVHRLCRSGFLHRVGRGIYAVGSPSLTQRGRWLAAVWSCGPHAVLSHRSAAALHEIRPDQRRRIDVTAPRSRHAPPNVDLHRTRRLEPHEITTIDGIPVTTGGPDARGPRRGSLRRHPGPRGPRGRVPPPPRAAQSDPRPARQSRPQRRHGRRPRSPAHPQRPRARLP